jgi:hypothetical protein
MILFQYPNTKTYLLETELDNSLVIPYSTVLSTITFFRCYFLLKLLKHFTRWTSSEAEEVWYDTIYFSEKHVCKPSIKFAFKAFQKENPFLALSVVFVLTCVCFGVALRAYELYYWETQDPKRIDFQNWVYIWNSMWCIFVSMTTGIRC